MSIEEASTSSRPAWFTSSYSNGAGGECVECGLMEHGAVVRDSKLSGGPEVVVGSRAWRAFVAALAQGHPAH
ncbi:DUF397 domain-containing protein [Streptomyces aurantiogriseus]|uniref:DUF397 domain-containing protein n=1 Tax=Streptomyces aurantiogriseus TaxID=66870 RepID=A0A918FIR8_9ACTN|nr:DUF397 domain-containing protein [Streptomyces aurantiogriseus]GGR40481.1 hypothetical protein GCM10010251_66550 [Streptomyces aurantiogriseus]